MWARASIPRAPSSTRPPASRAGRSRRRARMDTANPNQAMVLDFRAAPGFDATAEANRSLLVGALEQIEAGNFEAFWDIYDPDVTFYEASCLPYGGENRGIEATKRAYVQLSATFSEMRAVMEAVL